MICSSAGSTRISPTTWETSTRASPRWPAGTWTAGCRDAPTRRAWKRELGLTYTLASDFWPHGEAARAYGVFDEEKGAAVRGTFLIDKDGTVVWSLVNDADTRRTELTSAPLAVSVE